MAIFGVSTLYIIMVFAVCVSDMVMATNHIQLKVR